MEYRILFFAVIIVLCIVAGKFTSKYGVPSLLIFICLGMLFGTDGIFKIDFGDFEFSEAACSIALIFIMFYGGFGTNWKMAKPVAGKAIALSSLGVVLTALLTGSFCHFILGWNLLESFLLGSVISSTDAASVFSVLRSKKLNLKDGTASLLEMESGSNDPASYMLTVILLHIMEGGGVSDMALLVVTQIVFGILCGFGIGWIAIQILKKVDIHMQGFDTIFVFSIALIAYALPSVIGGNGYLSVYLAGLLIGNSKIKNKITLVHFFDGITGLAQMLIFFLLGILATPSRMAPILLPAIAIFLFITLVSRPAAVFVLMTPAKSSFRQQLLLSAAGLRGAASIVFAIMIAVSSVSTQTDIFHIVFCVALMSVAFQGTLLPWAARKLDMVDEEQNVMRTFNDYQEEESVQLIQMKLKKNNEYIGETISEVSFGGILVVMIKRGDETLIPKGDTILLEGDILVLSGVTYHGHEDVPLDEIHIESDHDWIGQQLKDIDELADSLIIFIKRANGNAIVPKGDTKIKEGDILVARMVESAE